MLKSMKKILLVFILVSSSMYQYGQIIADHTIVDDYDKIPEYYMNKVKQMWMSIPGASHSLGTLMGLNRLESENSTYAVNRTSSGEPEAYTDQYLRASQSTWGDLDNATGWMYSSYYAEDWFLDANAEAVTKAGIAYCNDNGYDLGALGFLWCYTGTNIDIGSYITTTQAYADYCKTQGYDTKIFFTTGPVDGPFSSGEAGWLMYQNWEEIRGAVKNDPSRILFDYADILCYDDGSDEPYTVTWDGNTYPVGTPTNTLPEEVGHIAAPGKLRLGKAMWWMLARMAGWDGGTTDVDTVLGNEDKVTLMVTDTEIILNFSGFNYSEVSLYDLNGKVVSKELVYSNSCVISIIGLCSGVYLVFLNGVNGNEALKVVL